VTRTPGLAPQPKELGQNGGRLCRGCHKEMPKGFRAWCSEECRVDKYVRAGWHVRFHVWNRDKGVCALCRADSEKAERIIAYLQGRTVYIRGEWRTRTPCDGFALVRSAWGRSYWDTSSLWEADHVIPVAEGGGGCGLDGYRTLCRPCHLAETKALRARLAAGRRESA
jgi:hypothetical protein